jgi:hypothetical protein
MKIVSRANTMFLNGPIITFEIVTMNDVIVTLNYRMIEVIMIFYTPMGL